MTPSSPHTRFRKSHGRHPRPFIRVLAACWVGLAGLPALPAGASPLGQEAVYRASVDSTGAQANSGSFSDASVSSDGQIVAFQSEASNLVTGDTNFAHDVFVHINAALTRRVSVASNGVEANDGSGAPSLSPDGRYVAFESLARNLDARDTDFQTDVFVHDILTGTTEMASVDSSGSSFASSASDPSISSVGRYVSFTASEALVPEDTNWNDDVYVRDRIVGTNSLASVGNSGDIGDGSSHEADISADGRYVSFWSDSSNLVSGDTNGCPDVFVRDRIASETVRVSVDTAGNEAVGCEPGYMFSGRATVSDEGDVAFESTAANLVSSDTNETSDVFVHDLSGGTTRRVSVSSGGAQTTGFAQCPSAQSTNGAISPDGQYVAFFSAARNLVPGIACSSPNHTYRHDITTGQTTLVSVTNHGGTASPNWSFSVPGSISTGGRYVAFGSNATNLVGGDTNATNDVFVRDMNILVSPIKDYVAMGDSYSSGEGAPPYSADSSTPPNTCHRSYAAYAHQVRAPGSTAPLASWEQAQ